VSSPLKPRQLELHNHLARIFVKPDHFFFLVGFLHFPPVAISKSPPINAIPLFKTSSTFSGDCSENRVDPPSLESIGNSLSGSAVSSRLPEAVSDSKEPSGEMVWFNTPVFYIFL
jgi:hypothetical protein